MSLGWYRLYTYDFRAAHEVVVRNPAVGASSASGCKLVAWDHFFRGETATTLATLAQCKASFPFDASIDLNLVVLNTMLGNAGAAQVACRNLEAMNASELILTLARSFERLSAGQSAQAGEELRAAFRQRGDLMVALLAGQAALAAGDARGAVEGLEVWLDKNPFSLEAHWLLCLAHEMATDQRAAGDAAVEGERWAARLDDRYHVPTTRLFRLYFGARAGNPGVTAGTVREVSAEGEAALTAYVRLATLARLGDDSALQQMVIPYSPTFWLNRFARLELERLRSAHAGHRAGAPR